MDGLFYLIPIALLIGLGALAAFLWALRTGQYEDLHGAAERVLDDDDRPLSAISGTKPTREFVRPESGR